MRAAKAIGIYALVVIVLGGLSAPWIFWSLQTIAGGRFAFPFYRVFHRVFLVIALLGLWPLFRVIGADSLRELGFLRVPWWWKHFLAGFLIGTISLSVLAGLLLLTGARTPDPSARPLASTAIKFLAIGLIVGIVEEAFFRGGLQTAFLRVFNSASAIGIVSLIYAYAHFLRPRGAPILVETVRWFTGFEHLRRLVSGSFTGPGFVLGMITYTLVGVCLGVAFARTGALYFSIGLHAGWVLLLKTFSAATRGADILANALTWLVLVTVLIFVAWITRSRLESVSSRDG